MDSYNTNASNFLFCLTVFTVACIGLGYVLQKNQTIDRLTSDNKALISHINSLLELDSLYKEKKVLEKRIEDTIKKRLSVKEVNLINAMIQVESEGNNSAYCAAEEAVGCLQIRPIMLREVNRILEICNKAERYTLEDRWSRDKSIEMFNVWKGFHHKDSSSEKIARNWNGGPTGINNPRTVRYWNKVKKEIKYSYASR